MWRWLAQHLPPSLEARELRNGYGTRCGIYRRGKAPGFLARALDLEGDPVATVVFNEVELHHPEYHSDFDDLLRRYEFDHPGTEVTLRYWES